MYCTLHEPVARIPRGVRGPVAGAIAAADPGFAVRVSSRAA